MNTSAREESSPTDITNKTILDQVDRFKNRLRYIPEDDRSNLRLVLRPYLAAVKELLEVEQLVLNPTATREEKDSLRSRLLSILAALNHELAYLAHSSSRLSEDGSLLLAELGGWYRGEVLDKVLRTTAPKLGIKGWDFPFIQQTPPSVDSSVVISFLP